MWRRFFHLWLINHHRTPNVAARIDVAVKALGIFHACDGSLGRWFSVRIMPYLQLNLADAGFEPQAPWKVTDQGEMLGTVELSLGDDVTVAFTKNSNFYQVMTATDFAEPLADILRTWQFTD
jgi:hypothetical protein